MICMNNVFSLWKNKFPRQGWLYLSVEYLCFHSYILGIEEKIVVRWTDVVNLEKINNVISDTIKITTRDKREVNIQHIIISKVFQLYLNYYLFCIKICLYFYISS